MGPLKDLAGAGDGPLAEQVKPFKNRLQPLGRMLEIGQAHGRCLCGQRLLLPPIPDPKKETKTQEEKHKVDMENPVNFIKKQKGQK